MNKGADTALEPREGKAPGRGWAGVRSRSAPRVGALTKQRGTQKGRGGHRNLDKWPPSEPCLCYSFSTDAQKGKEHAQVLAI